MEGIAVQRFTIRHQLHTLGEFGSRALEDARSLLCARLWDAYAGLDTCRAAGEDLSLFEHSECGIRNVA